MHNGLKKLRSITHTTSLTLAIGACLIASAKAQDAGPKSGAVFGPAGSPAQIKGADAPPALQKNGITTLRDAIAVGVLTNPEYGVVAASRRATDEELAQGRALFLPSLDLNADAGWEYTENSNTRGGVDGDDSEELFRRQASLTLTQLLFDGWGAHYEVERQKYRVLSSAHRVRETAELVGLSIAEAYLDVMRQRELLEIARQNVKDHQGILGRIEDGVRGGRSTRADQEQAGARLASARAAEASTQEALRRAEASFKQQVGEMPANLELPALPGSYMSSDIEVEVEKTLASSPTLDIYEADINVADAEAKGTLSSYYPQVDLKLNGTKARDIGGIEEQDDSASALVVMNWNLYRGGGDTARRREYIHRQQQAKETRARVARALENDVRSTWASLVSAHERASAFADQTAANQQVVSAYLDQFSLDRRTLLDVLDSQNELFVTSSNRINAEYLERFAYYRLQALKGALLPSLDIAYPRETLVGGSAAQTATN